MTQIRSNKSSRWLAESDCSLLFDDNNSRIECAIHSGSGGENQGGKKAKWIDELGDMPVGPAVD